MATWWMRVVLLFCGTTLLGVGLTADGLAIYALMCLLRALELGLDAAHRRCYRELTGRDL